MSVTFTKLFSSITASTVWCEPSDTRVVWITMLAMADRRGRVWASIPGLAKDAAVSVDACRVAIEKFLSPDPDSRTKVADGRRIEPIDGGWRLMNHAKYRALRDEEERRIYKTEKQQEYRKKNSPPVDNVDKSGQCGPPLTAVDSSGHNAEAEADADTEAKEQQQKQKPSPKPRKRVSEDGMKHSTTPRHLALKAEIEKYWKSKNNFPMPWGPGEGAQLGMWESANPQITIEQFTSFLRNRFKSPVNHGDRPRKWIANITSWAHGPTDAYGNPPKTNGNGARYAGKQDHLIAILNEPEIEEGTERNGAVSGGQPDPGTGFSLR